MNKTRQLLRCSFCDKAQNEVRKLVAGPTVFICNECVDLCIDIITHDVGENVFTSRPLQIRVVNQARQGDATNCSWCNVPLFVFEGLMIEDRGILCPACVAIFEAAISKKRMERE